jgi:hypothetical protein
MSRSADGQFRYGETQADLRDELRDYSRANAYVAKHYADAICTCGNGAFKVLLDNEEGAAVRVCTACGESHPIGDSGEYLAEAHLTTCVCPCGAVTFEVSVGVALYRGSEDVKWLYIGCRCIQCGLVACYGDWKNEFEGYQTLLARV